MYYSENQKYALLSYFYVCEILWIVNYLCDTIVNKYQLQSRYSNKNTFLPLHFFICMTDSRSIGKMLLVIFDFD